MLILGPSITVASSRPEVGITISGTILRTTITSLIKTTTDTATRLNYVGQWQALAYNELPSIPIDYSREVVAFDSNFPNAQTAFNAYHYPAWPAIEHLSTVAPDASSTF